MKRGREIGYSKLAIVAAVDLQGLHSLLVVDVERVTDPAQRRRGARDALDYHVVVGRGLVVGPRRDLLLVLLDPFLLHEYLEGQLDEGAERPRFLTWCRDDKRLVGIR